MVRLTWIRLIAWVTLLVVAFLPPQAVAQEDAEEANKAVLIALWQAETERDYEQIAVVCAEGLVRHSISAEAFVPEARVNTLDEYVAFVQSTATQFPDYAITPVLLAAEDDIVAFYSRFTGHNPVDGSTLDIPMFGFARFQDEKIIELWVEWEAPAGGMLEMVDEDKSAPDVVEPPHICSDADLVENWHTRPPHH